MTDSEKYEKLVRFESYESLLNRVESGDGYDNDLAEAIFVRVRGKSRIERCEACGQTQIWCVPNLTSSLDAILRVIQDFAPSWRLQDILHHRGGEWRASLVNEGRLVEGIGRTPARALLSAFIRVKQGEDA